MCQFLIEKIIEKCSDKDYSAQYCELSEAGLKYRLYDIRSHEKLQS